MAKPTRFPSLDGWRALSILLVLGVHSRSVVGFPQNAVFNLIPGGNLGVRCFFVISGFLITHLLYQEYHQTGHISLRRFYIRRALRILPVYYVYLFVVFLLQVFTPFHQSALGWLGNLTFTTNYFGDAWTTEHLWSLGVEEQFYLLWPLLLVFIGLKGNQRAVFYILGMAIAIAPVWRVISHLVIASPLDDVSARGLIAYLKTSPLEPLFKGFSFFNYFDSLAVGCLAAILLTKHEPQISALLEKTKWKSILFGVVLILIPFLLQGALLSAVFPPLISVAFADTFQSVGFVILLLHSVRSPQLFKPLNWPVIRTLGVLSYSIYIWQMLFCSNPKTFGWPNFWFMTFPGWLFAALLVATISYYGLEKPLMGLRAYFRKPEPK